jgi:hypothetical protein
VLRLVSKYKRIIAHRFAMCHLFVTRGLLTCFGCGKGRAARQCATSHLRVGLPRGALGLRPSAGRGNSVGLSSGMTHNVCVCAVVAFRSRHCPRGKTLNEDNAYSLHVPPPLRKHFVTASALFIFPRYFVSTI